MAYKCENGMSGAREGAYMRSVWSAVSGGGGAGSGVGQFPDIFGAAQDYLQQRSKEKQADAAAKAAEAAARAAKYQASAASAPATAPDNRTRNLVLGGAAVVLTGVLAWSVLRRRARGG